MWSNKMPVIGERYRLAHQQIQTDLREAFLAEASEEVYGDVVHSCEVKTDTFEYLRAELMKKHATALSLFYMGRLPLQVAQSHYDQLVEATHDETFNQAVQAAAVASEAYFDLIETQMKLKVQVSQRLISILKDQWAAA